MKVRIVFIFLISLFLSACNSVSHKKNPTIKNKEIIDETRLSIPNISKNLSAQEYVEKKQMASQGIVIASTRNACVDGFNFLKGFNQEQFDKFSSHYSKINQNYIFLNVNKEIMDKDSKELLSMTLNKKLDTLCAKVQYAGFIGVKERLKTLSDN
ncbi:hypothetical protein [Morganella morganii]|uniref:hypothetical protein n=1 Tax=Morganella morganii TaxID=582 RepID=UPI0034D50A56